MMNNKRVNKSPTEIQEIKINIDDSDDDLTSTSSENTATSQQIIPQEHFEFGTDTKETSKLDSEKDTLDTTADSAFPHSYDRQSSTGSSTSSTVKKTGIPISSEITIDTRYRPSISHTELSINDNPDTSSTSGIGSYEGTFAQQPLSRSSSSNIQPYAISDIRVFIPEQDFNKSYHNPYAQFIEGLDEYGHLEPVFSSSRSPSDLSDPQSPGEASLARSASLRSKISSHCEFTRQLNLFIGEEWENVMPYHTMERKSRSCPPTIRAQAVRTRQPLAIGKTRHLDIRNQRFTQARRRDPLQHFFYHLPPEPLSVRPQKEQEIRPNPYNEINHKIHACLHCPCFFFFFLLCCFPGVHQMQLGDIEYKSGREDEARLHGKRATILYVLGAIIGTLVLSVLVFFAVFYVQQEIGVQ